MVVRSPIDAIVSLFNLTCTRSHNNSIIDEDFITFRDIWHDFIEEEIKGWALFHDFWLKAKIPVHIIRFEDILTNT